MSANNTQTVRGAEGAAIDGDDEPPIEYEETLSQSRGTHDDVAEDWVAGVYPDNERSSKMAGVIYADDYTARQYDDGTGKVEWRRETEAIRTINGLVLTNNNMGRRSNGGMFGSPHSARSVRNACRDANVERHSINMPFVRSILRQGSSERERPRDHKYHLSNVVEVEGSGWEGQLITFANGDQVYIGTDETAHGSGRFGFVIDEQAPVPSPKSALELLVPDPVRRARADGADVTRQGEWFFVHHKYADLDMLEISQQQLGQMLSTPEQTVKEPVGSVQNPGVSERPYGASPLENHVPRDWATVVADDEFVERFVNHDEIKFSDRQSKPRTPQECVTALHTGDVHYKSSLSWEQVPELADGIWIRGSIRHRDNEHYVENFDEWHLAVTHDVEVFTIDDSLDNVRVD